MTLIELIIAMLLSVLIISGLCAIYLVAENNRTEQADLITIQNNTKIMRYFLSNHLRMAGYVGCAKLTADFPFHNHLAIPISLQNKIHRYTDREVKADSDAVVIWHASTQQVSLVETMQDNSILYVAPGLIFYKGENIVITDCKTIEIAKIKAILLLKNGIQRIIIDSPLKKRYGKNSDVAKLQIEAFFIGDSGRKDNSNKIIYALYMRDSGNNKIELIEGVSDMKIQYDFFTDELTGEYPAREITDSSSVGGILINMTLDSVAGFSMQKKWSMFVALSQ